MSSVSERLVFCFYFDYYFVFFCILFSFFVRFLRANFLINFFFLFKISFNLQNRSLLRYPAVVGARAKRYRGHGGMVRSVRFTEDDRFLLTAGGTDKTIFLWNVTSIDNDPSMLTLNFAASHLESTRYQEGFQERASDLTGMGGGGGGGQQQQQQQQQQQAEEERTVEEAWQYLEGGQELSESPPPILSSSSTSSSSACCCCCCCCCCC